MLDCRRRTRAPHAGLHLVGDVENAVLLADRVHALDELLGHRQETALALHGLEDHCGDLGRVDLALEHLAEPVERQLRRDAAIQVRRGRTVDLGGKRPHALLVRHRLGRQRHANERAAVEALIEADDRVALRGVAGDLDRVLDGLGARVEQEPLERPLAGMTRNHALDGLDVALVLDHGVHLVHVAGGLLLDGRDDSIRRVAAVERTNATDEVDVLASLDIGDARAMRVIDEQRLRRHRRGHPALALGLQRRGLGSGSLIDRH